jgi:hypothetical protein
MGGAVGKNGVALLMAMTLAAGAVGFVSTQAQTRPEQRRSVTKTGTAAGTVKTVSNDSVVVIGKARGKAVEWTFAVDAKTRIQKGGKDVTAGALTPGDQVSVRYTEHAGRTIAQGVTVTGSARRGPEKRP